VRKLTRADTQDRSQRPAGWGRCGEDVGVGERQVCRWAGVKGAREDVSEDGEPGLGKEEENWAREDVQGGRGSCLLGGPRSEQGKQGECC